MNLLSFWTVDRGGMAATGERSRSRIATVVLLLVLSFSSVSLAYRPGDIVPMSKMGQYHSSRTMWHDMIGKHCPIFGVNREVLVPIAKPTGYTGADPYKISFQVGREKYQTPWLYVINRKSSEVPMIDVHLRYAGGDLHGITAKVVDMPHHYVEIHPNIRKQFWDPQHWPKHVLVRYTWEEHSDIDVTAGFYVLFGSGLTMSFILSIYILQSSRDKLARFVRETVGEGGIPSGVIAKVE
ncbi:unnamed protein product [Linum tenue]|uniref:Uncharacterized protein n=1 Tax=Linum tenue TaxID=586396 RepID=A0AAV0KNV8_9ROSI|nr:unnamed protein product [Linum tenue]